MHEITKVEKIIFEGYGLCRTKSGKPVFVWKAVPGDLLEIRIVEEKKSFCRGEIVKIIEPSTQRIEPVCPHFELCGGCEHQNLSASDQIKMKEEIFADVMSRGHLELKPEPIISGSDQDLYYRNVSRFFIQQDEDQKISYFMHHFNYREGLVEIKECFLQSKKTNEILEKFKELVNSLEGDKSNFWQIRLREGKKTNEFMVEIMTYEPNLPSEAIIGLFKSIEGITSVYHAWNENGNLNRLKRRLLFGAPIIFEKIGKYKFQISPESFFQTNSLGVETLYNKIKEYAEPKVGETILDLYCGTGTIGLYLSTLPKKIIGVEIVPEAIRDAIDNAKINKVQNCEFICSEAERWFYKNYKTKFDKIIIDPPRSGLTRELITNIGACDFGSIVYVSCNPATFVRDVKFFEEQGIKLKKVQPLDMFPQTHHIECVGLLERIS